MKIDHVAINAVKLEEEIDFFVRFLGLKLLQQWTEPKQAYVGLDDGLVLGIIENSEFNGSFFTMAHIAFNVPEHDFVDWVAKVNTHNIDIVSGPKEQRGGQTILIRTPSKNIVELCYLYVREAVASQII